MIAHKREFGMGAILMVLFLVVLGIIFSPSFAGKNGLDYLDSLYNSISKGSAYYIPKVAKKVETLKGNAVTLDLKMENEVQAGQTAKLLEAGGASVRVDGAALKVSGDLGAILANGLSDADAMYANNGEAVSSKYGYNERQALYNWWVVLKATDKALKKQEKFKEAAVAYDMQTKAVEAAYNYYGIEAKKITTSLGIVIFSLVGYVLYTMWYGFSILFMFEGWGLKLEH